MNPKDDVAAKPPIPCLLPDYSATPPEEPPFVAILRHQASLFPKATGGDVIASVQVYYDTSPTSTSVRAALVIHAPKLDYTYKLLTASSDPTDRSICLTRHFTVHSFGFPRSSSNEPQFIANLRDALHDPPLMRLISSLISNSRVQDPEEPQKALAEPQALRAPSADRREPVGTKETTL